MKQNPTERAIDKHPRHSIYAYGCSDTVYKVIEKDHRVRYAPLLKTASIFGEQPRGEEAQGAVRKLKQFWSFGMDSFHWLQSDFLQGVKGQDLVKDRLEAGEIGDTLMDEEGLQR